MIRNLSLVLHLLLLHRIHNSAYTERTSCWQTHWLCRLLIWIHAGLSWLVHVVERCYYGGRCGILNIIRELDWGAPAPSSCTLSLVRPFVIHRNPHNGWLIVAKYSIAFKKDASEIWERFSIFLTGSGSILFCDIQVHNKSPRNVWMGLIHRKIYIYLYFLTPSSTGQCGSGANQHRMQSVGISFKYAKRMDPVDKFAFLRRSET